MMGGRPQDTRSVVQITVGLDIEGQTAVLPVSQRRAHRGRRAVTNAICAVASNKLIMFGEVPQPGRPPALEHNIRHERPVFILDLVPQLGGQAGRGDRAGVPTPSRFLQGLLLNSFGCLSKASAASL